MEMTAEWLEYYVKERPHSALGQGKRNWGEVNQQRKCTYWLISVFIRVKNHDNKRPAPHGARTPQIDSPAPHCRFALRAKAAPLSIRTYRPLRVRPQRGHRACRTSYIGKRISQCVCPGVGLPGVLRCTGSLPSPRWRRIFGEIFPLRPQCLRYKIAPKNGLTSEVAGWYKRATLLMYTKKGA